MKNKLNPLLENLRRLVLEDKVEVVDDSDMNPVEDNAGEEEKKDSIIDKYADKVEKTNAVDPIMLASLVTPIPGAAIVGNAYTKAISKKDRAKAYKEIVKHPFKSLAKAPIKVPEAAIKTVANIPKATYDFGKDVVTKVSHPKKTYRDLKKSVNKSLNSIKKWYKKRKEKSENENS